MCPDGADGVQLVGITPKAYLTNTGLLKARAKLQSSNESTLSIAESAGYASEAAFSKALRSISIQRLGNCARGAFGFVKRSEYGCCMRYSFLCKRRVKFECKSTNRDYSARSGLSR